MPSSLSAGVLYKRFRVSQLFTVLSGGRLRIEAAASAPANPVRGDLYVTAAGVLMIYNGTAWVSVGSQT